MFRKLPLLVLFVVVATQAQEKIRGSRNVTTEQYTINSFHSIKISGDLEVGILKGGRPMVEIKADDNLHSLIQTEVVDGVLIIRPIKEFRREKAQEVKVTFSEQLKKISITDGVSLESLQDLTLEDFELETRGKSRAYLTLEANVFNLINGDDATVELNLTGQDTYFQLKQSSSIKALVNTPSFKIDSHEKSSARIEGEVTDLSLRTDQSASFDGEKLTSTRATLNAAGRTKTKINVAEVLELTATGSSKIEVYNTPKINLIEFSDKAVIEKK